jgi:hypothetical protein
MKVLSVMMWMVIVLTIETMASQALHEPHHHKVENSNCQSTPLGHSTATKKVCLKEGVQKSEAQQESTFRPLPAPSSIWSALQSNGTAPVDPTAGIVVGVVVLICCCCCCAILGVMCLLICLCITFSSVAAFFAPCLASLSHILVVLGCGFLVGAAAAKNNAPNVVVVNSGVSTTPTTVGSAV